MTTLYIPANLYEKMMVWVDYADGEVCGIGRVEAEKNNFCLKDVWLLEQKVGPAEAEFSAEGLAKLLVELAEAGDDLHGLYFWWHSHVNMTAKFSSIDDKTMAEWQGPYVLAYVINKKQESSCMLYSREPIPITLKVDTQIIWTHSADREALIKEFDEKVTEVATPTITRRPGYAPTFDKAKGGSSKKSYYFEDDEDTEGALCDWCGCRCKPEEKDKCSFILKLRAGQPDEAVEDMLEEADMDAWYDIMGTYDSDDDKEFERFRQQYVTG